MARVALAVATGLLLLWILLAPFAWILRDGLGPESVESRGLAALARAVWAFWWGPIATALAVSVLILKRVTGPGHPLAALGVAAVLSALVVLRIFA